MKILNKLVLMVGLGVMSYGATFEVFTTAQLRQAFEDAMANGQNDIIVLNAGTYKTTDDGFGTFKFSDVEDKNLTIKGKDGIDKESIILDGANTHQVLNLTSTKTTTFSLSGFIVTGGNGITEGGGIYTNKPMIVDNCKVFANKGGIYGSVVTISNSTISGNTSSSDGGGIYGSTVNVSNSIISGNTSSKDCSGGGIYGSTVNISNSTVSGNTVSNYGNGGGIYGTTVNISNSTINGNASTSGGGGIYGSTVNISNSTISSNNSSSRNGGGIYGSTVNVSNSIISGNTSSYGAAGIDGGNVTVFQSIFKDNKSTSGTSHILASSYGGSVKIISSTFINNGGIAISGKGFFINNIISGSTTDISFSGDSKLYNNYLDYTKLANQTSYTIIKKNIIQPNDGNLGIDDNGTLLENSILIDKGLSPTDATYLTLISESGIYNPLMTNGKYKTYATDTYGSTTCNETCKDMNTTYQMLVNNTIDLAGNIRVIGTSIDIGAFEYGATDTKPNISSITPPSTIKVFDSVSFGITASASGDRTIVSTLVDYEGNGNYVNSTTPYKYTNSGTYTAKIKVIDSSSEEKIVEQAIVVNELTRDEAINYGKNMCVSDPSSCGLGVILPDSLSATEISALSSGQWYLMGTSSAINDLSIFNSATILWIYENGTWKAKSANVTMQQSITNSEYETIQSIKENQGFWIKK